MAVSPGPASTVLRFLRGGCGQDDGCLCGRLCEPCRRGDGCEPSEGTVQRVTPERVVLVDGRVFRRPGGASPRPGQTVIVDCRPGLIARTPFAPPHIQQVDAPVFIPAIPSYDSPQRPGHWGSGFIPGVAAEPTQPPRTFTHVDVGDVAPVPALKPSFPLAFQQLDGTTTGLSAGGPLRVTPGMAAVTLGIVRRTLYPAGFAFALDPYGPFGQGVYHPRGDIRATPEELSPFGALPAIEVPEEGLSEPITLHMIRYRLGADQTLVDWYALPDREFVLAGGVTYPAFDAIGARWAEQLAGGFTSLAQGAEVVIERRGPLKVGGLRTGAGDIGAVSSLEVYREERPGGARYWTLGYQQDDGSPSPPEAPPGGEWYAGAVLQIRPSGDPFPWGAYSCYNLFTMPREFTPEPELPWTERRWQSPGGLIQFVQGDGADVPDILSAYGVTLEGGTWAGLRGPVTPERLEYWISGEDDPGEALVLHEREGTVTAIWPDGTAETRTRTAFEQGVLGCPDGAFRGFSRIGLGSNVWPPEWAWAVTGPDEGRALVAWEMWRDSVKGQLGRPRRRPDPQAPAPPPRPGLRPPLGVTLATTARAPRHEEPLRARDADSQWGQPPWHLPMTAEALRGGAWADVLNALAKPALYPPARQEEALDDTSNTPPNTTLRLTWAGPVMPAGPGEAAQAALLLRARVRAGQLPVLTVNGASATVRPLGRNAGLKGWQPFVATWGAEYAAAHAAGLTLTCSASLSRLLLTRVGRGKAEGGGTDA